MLRSSLAILAGLLAGVTVAWLVELPATLMFPLPARMDPFDKVAMKKYMDSLPTLAQASGIIAWTAAAFAGAWLAARIARSSAWLHGLVTGVLFLAPAVLTILVFPHPLWLAIIGVLAPPFTACIGATLAAHMSLVASQVTTPEMKGPS